MCPASRGCSQKLLYLRDRAKMFGAARAFFDERHVLEVDCPALSTAAPIDKHIDVMKVLLKEGQMGYLHTSPEYGMKRLLASGIGDIYQISHVFRDGEVGDLHNPEFTMVEWYRCGFSFEQMIEETLAFIRLFLGDLPVERFSYREVFQRYLDIDYTHQTPSTLIELAHAHGLSLSSDASEWDKDTLLQLLLTTFIEPKLSKESFFVLTHYPATQAALAKTEIYRNNRKHREFDKEASQNSPLERATIAQEQGASEDENFEKKPTLSKTDSSGYFGISSDGEEVALRFEVYFCGIELANGYHELTDPVEQRRRFAEASSTRTKQGKDSLVIDEKFLGALQSGMPDCCGVAVGFDRLMLLKHNQRSLSPILPFCWSEI